MTTINEFN